jgi:hypothetical protein
MKWLRIFIIFVVTFSFFLDSADARRRRRRGRGRSKVYSPPSKFHLQDRNGSFEIKKNKLFLYTETGNSEMLMPFQTTKDQVAGMAYIPMAGRHFIQVVLWAVDVNGNFDPKVTTSNADGQSINQLLYWDLYEVVGDKIVWRSQQLLDMFVGSVSKDLPPHLENAIQLTSDDSGKVYFRRGAVEELVPSDS